MKISLVKGPDPVPRPVVSVDGETWYAAGDILPQAPLDNTLAILSFELENPGSLQQALLEAPSRPAPVDLSTAVRLLPFEPRSYRDFMLYEAHVINATRGFVKKYLPRKMPVIDLYRRITGRPHPRLKPKKRWYQYPIYYLGNHLAFVTHGDPVRIPAYTTELDYELELGAVICRGLKNADAAEAQKAVGGFVVFNDFSARDVQMDEMMSGFGPMKAKNFANSISNVVVTADEIWPRIDRLKARVFINGEKIAENDSGGAHYSLAEAIAYASWEEQLYPGEFFASGTIPGCTGLENGRFLHSGDTIRLEIAGIGVLENPVV